MNKKEILNKISFLEKHRILYIVGILCLIIYLFTKIPTLGLVVGLCIFGLVAIDIVKGYLTEGAKSEFKEILIAIIVAVAVWQTMSFLLDTNAPINAVVSCSMLPNLNRGDMIILRGGEIDSTAIYLTEDPNLITNIATIEIIGIQNLTVNGSFYSYCTQNNDPLCYHLTNSPELVKESNGPLTFTYEKCNKYNLNNEINTDTICTKSVIYNGVEYEQNYSNDIVVYAPKKSDVFAFTGDIIHRVYLEIVAPNGDKYYLIKGDNNPVFDIQMYSKTYGMGNSLVSEEQVKGKVLFGVPIVGYSKLLISGLSTEPKGCDTKLLIN